MHAPPSAGIRSDLLTVPGTREVFESSQWPREKWPGSQAPSHPVVKQQLRWSRRGPRVALERSFHRLSMRYDADRGRLVFRKRTRQTGPLVPDAIAMGVRLPLQLLRPLRRTSRRHEQEGGISNVEGFGRVRGEDDKIPPIKTVAPDLPLRRAPVYGHPRRSVVCTHLCTANTLRIRPAHARTSGAYVSRSDVPSYEGVGPVRPPPDRHARSHMQHRLLHLRVRRARGQRKDRQVLGGAVPLAAAPSRRVGSKRRRSQVPLLRPHDRAHRERDAA